MLELTGRIAKVAIDMDGRMQLTLDINEPDTLKAGYDVYKNVGLLDIKIGRHAEAKSREANAYFHVLVREIAAAITTSFQECKNTLIAHYGQPELLDDGTPATFVSSIPIRDILLREDIHAYPVGSDGENTIYQIYRGVHTYNKQEMSILLDGTVADAMSLGIDVYPKKRIEEIKDRYQPKP